MIHRPTINVTITTITTTSAYYFYPGFLSNMHSSKACKIYQYATLNNLECTLFDRYGHGSSRPHYTSTEYDGTKATMGRWLQDSLDVLDNITNQGNKQILVGSSMGTRLAILTAMERPERVAGIIGIASAPDYTALLRHQIGSNERWATELEKQGYVDVPTVYDRRGYYRIHKELLAEGEDYLLLQDGDHKKKLTLSALPKDIPIRLIHGLADEDIPYQYSERLAERLREQNHNVRLDLIPGGDHRLSTAEHLDKLREVLDEVVEETSC